MIVLVIAVPLMVIGYVDHLLLHDWLLNHGAIAVVVVLLVVGLGFGLVQRHDYKG